MIEQMHEVQAKLDLLVGALDGHDAGAIVSATEDLATAVILFRGAGVPAGSEMQARALIGKYAGDIAQVQAPGGMREFEILDVRYE